MTTASKLTESVRNLLDENFRLNQITLDQQKQISTLSLSVRELGHENTVLTNEILDSEQLTADEGSQESGGDTAETWKESYQIEATRAAELSIANFEGGKQVTKLLIRVDALRNEIDDLTDTVKGERSRADEMTTARDVAVDEANRNLDGLNQAQAKITELLSVMNDRDLRIMAVQQSDSDVTRARQLYEFMKGTSDIKMSDGFLDAPRSVRDNPQA